MLVLMYARNATQRNGPNENILTILWITCCISFTACYTIQKLVTFCKIVTKREILLRTIPLIFLLLNRYVRLSEPSNFRLFRETIIVSIACLQ